MQKISLVKNTIVVLFLTLATSCASILSDDHKSQTQEVSEKKLQTVQSSPIKIIEATSTKSTDEAVLKKSAHVSAAHAEVSKTLGADVAKASATAHQSSGHSEHNQGVDAEVALRWLKNGNTRFVKNFIRKDGQSIKDVQRLAAGQKPHTVVISCSDSRVPPEIIFDQKLGEIFVIRTAGEAVDTMTLASLEYAISHLGPKNILVLGHTHCGAVKAACGTLSGGDAGSENLNGLVKDIHPRIEQFKGKTNTKGFYQEAWANADGVADDLSKRSGIVSMMLKNKDIKINTAIYNMETGVVDFERK